jgi:outer membrane lipoprotein-sorting protein
MPRHRRLPSTERRRLLGALGALALGGLGSPAAPAAAAAFDLAALMQLLGTVRSGEATFVERREVAMLDRTIVTSGRLSFEAPDTFVRETLKPSHERLAVTGNTLTMSRGERSRTVQLDATPEAAVIVEAIRGTLTGNRAALERLFTPTVGGSAERWTLELVPREARLRNQVAGLRVSGAQAVVREVAVTMADGDRSLMTIEPSRGAARSAKSDAARAPTRPASLPP